MANSEIGAAYLSVYARMDKSFGSDVISKATALGTAVGNIVSQGIQKVAGLASDAISRTDIINNYPKVMQSLGYSADSAASSIKSIQAGVKGLPTSTASLVSFVQKLAATTGDLGKATSVGIGFNDMMLAGGASTQVAEAACEQYNQMLAAGKVDQQAWNSVVSAAPGQMKQLAQTLLGANANQKDLYEALKTGKISLDDMNNAISQLDQQGGEGFASFHDQAMSATAGIGTALENFRSRAVNAVVSVIQAIGSDTITGPINAISSNFGHAADVSVSAIVAVKQALEDSAFGDALSAIAQDASGFLPTLDEVKQAASDFGSAVGNTLGTIASAVYDSGIASAFSDLMQSVGGLLDRIGQQLPSLDDMLYDLFDLIEALLAPIRDAMEATSQWLDSLDAGQLETFEGIVKGALSAFLAWKGISSVIGIINSAKTAMSGLQIVMQAMQMVKSVQGLGAVLVTLAGGPMTVIVAAIAAVIGVLVTLYSTNEDFRDGVNSIWSGIVSFFQGIPSAIEGAFHGLAAFFAGLVDAVSQGFDAVVSFVSGIPATISSAVAIVAGVIQQVVETIMANPIAQALAGIVSGIVQIVQGAIQTVVSVVQAAIGLVVGIVTGDWTMLSDAVSGILMGLATIIAGIWNTIASTIEAAVMAVAAFLAAEWAGIVAVAETVWNGLIAFFAAVPGAIEAAFGAIAGFFSGLWSGIVSVAQGIWNALVAFVTGIPGRIMGGFSSLGSFFSGVWNSISSGAQRGFSSMLSYISSIPGQIVGFFSSIPGKIEAMFRSIHVPTLHVEGGFNLDPLNFQIPTISFYAKGGLVGGLYTRPHIGVVGEAGPEIISPVETLRKMIAEAVSSEGRSLEASGHDDALEEIVSLLKSLLDKDTDIYLDGDTLVGRTAEAMDRALGARKMAGAR